MFRQNAGDDIMAIRSPTPRERDVINAYLESPAGKTRSIREVGAAIGARSTSTVFRHLANLEARGLIAREPKKHRSIRILWSEERASEHA
jgi:SOS-response transcriptional repressor LexA